MMRLWGFDSPREAMLVLAYGLTFTILYLLGITYLDALIGMWFCLLIEGAITWWRHFR